MARTVTIGLVDQIPRGEGRNFVVDDEKIAVFHTHTGEVFATQAECPHLRGPLADGMLGGTTIHCPLHDRAFDLRSGEGIGGGCERLKVFAVELTDGKKVVVRV